MYWEASRSFSEVNEVAPCFATKGQKVNKMVILIPAISSFFVNFFQKELWLVEAVVEPSGELRKRH